MSKTRRGTAGTAALAAAVAITILLSPGPAMADKLVIFKNGKALLASTAEEDGQWLKVSFGGDDWMSVPVTSIAEVIDAALAPGARAAAPNQLVEGELRNFANRGGAQVDTSRGARALGRAQDQEDVPVEEDNAGVAAGVPRSTARTVRNQQNTPQANPIVPGLTPLNTNPTQPTGLQRRGRFSGTDKQAETEQEEQEQEDDN